LAFKTKVKVVINKIKTLILITLSLQVRVF